jgi:hypothetical protein
MSAQLEYVEQQIGEDISPATELIALFVGRGVAPHEKQTDGDRPGLR